MTFRIAIAALAASLFLVPAAARASTSQGRPDAALAVDVRRSVDSYSRYTVFDDVGAQVDGGVVTLTGKVTLPFKKEEIGKRVAAVTGVKDVRNEIGVLPASASDEELRHRVARGIYGDAAFWRYAAMANPPIHILVEDGHVTLTGVVRSESEVKLARSLATGHGERSLTCRLRVEGR